MFTPKSKVGRCASCNAIMSNYSDVVEETTGNADYALMNGTWVYTALKNGIATKKVFVDVKESKDASGVKSSSEYVVISEYTDKKGWETKAATGPVSTTYDKTTGVRSLTVTVDDSTYKISEKDGKPTLTLSSENDLLENEKGTLIFKENHNHLYATAVSEGTTAAAAAINAKSIYEDSYFENMTFLGQNLMNETNHYVSCSECGITNYAVAHKTSDHKAVTSTNVCTCGYTANTDATKGNIYNPVYIYSAEARFDFADYDTVVEYWNSMDPSKATGTEDSADDAGKRTAATSVAKQASDTARTAYELAGGTIAGSPSQLLYNLADALNTAVSTYGNTGLGGNLSGVEGAAQSYDENYNEDPGKVYQAYTTLAETVGVSGTLGTEGVSAAVDALARAIAEDAKAIVETAVETAKATAISDAEDSELDHFVVLKGTVLSLDYASYTTSGNCKNTFADNTGWATVGSGAQLTAEGYRVIGSAFLFYSNR